MGTSLHSEVTPALQEPQARICWLWAALRTGWYEKMLLRV